LKNSESEPHAYFPESDLAELVAGNQCDVRPEIPAAVQGEQGVRVLRCITQEDGLTWITHAGGEYKQCKAPFRRPAPASTATIKNPYFRKSVDDTKALLYAASVRRQTLAFGSCIHAGTLRSPCSTRQTSMWSDRST